MGAGRGAEIGEAIGEAMGAETGVSEGEDMEESEGRLGSVSGTGCRLMGFASSVDELERRCEEEREIRWGELSDGTAEGDTDCGVETEEAEAEGSSSSGRALRLRFSR